jgi:hypothetical protein
MPWFCSPTSVSDWLSTKTATYSDLFPTKETQPMKKLTVRYIRYALALLANVGFQIYAN